MTRDYTRILPRQLPHSARLGIDEDELCEQRDPRNRDQLMIPCGGAGEAFKTGPEGVGVDSAICVRVYPGSA